MGMYIPNMKSEQFYDLCKEHGLEIIAVPVPPHGRLIDADALEDALGNFCDDNWVYNTLRHTPTIIEAEEET